MQVADSGNNFLFMSKPPEFIDNLAFVAHIPKIGGRNQLFKELADKLWFPDYFGNNWNAVSDCIRDFMWIDQKDIVIVIVHDSFIEMSNYDFETYIEVLSEGVKHWTTHNNIHTLRVVFRTDLQEIINNEK